MWWLLASLASAAPWLGVRGSVYSGFPDVTGLNVGYTAPVPLAAEAGVSRLAFAHSAYLRAGPVARVTDGDRWTVQLAPRVGYRLILSRPADETDRFHGLSLDGAVDAVRWLGRLGIAGQLQGGATGWLARTNPAAKAWLPELRVSLGLALR